jgi:aarF domain-containing kinase
MLRKTIKYGLISGVGLAGMVSLQRNDWNVNAMPVVRLGRAAITTAAIAVEYKQLTLNEARKGDAKEWSDVHTKAAERILKLCTSNGGVFVKVGQHIASLEYLVPPEYCEVLKVLHHRAPVSPLSEVKQMIEQAFGQKIDQLFREFDEKPLGICFHVCSTCSTSLLKNRPFQS